MTAGVKGERDSADQLETRLKRISDWPSIICAITLVAEGAIKIDPDRHLEDGSCGVSVCDVPMSLGGLKLMEDIDHRDVRMWRIYKAVLEAVARCSEPTS